MTTRVELRTLIREKLREFYDTDVVATGGISSSATLLPITIIDRYKEGDTILVESEMMKVVDIDEANNQITVLRGYLETTAAAHLAAAAIKIFPEFTDRMLNNAINEAIADTTIDPDTGVGIWTDVQDTTLTTSTSTREYTKPAAVEKISNIEIQDDNGNYQPFNYWRQSGSKIVFYVDFSRAGDTIRVNGIGYQAILAADATALTITDKQAMFIVYKTAALLVEGRLPARAKATQYSASVNDRAGQPDEMRLLSRHLNNEAIAIKRREGRPFPMVFANRMKR